MEIVYYIVPKLFKSKKKKNLISLSFKNKNRKCLHKHYLIFMCNMNVMITKVTLL